jgi:IMP cyclohydrolase
MHMMDDSALVMFYNNTCLSLEIKLNEYKSRGFTMNNPNGPYPGRQLFLGLTSNNDPCFAYLVTGRSPESRERKAVLMGDAIRMGPLGDAQYDPLRHYAAVKYDNASGLLCVTNGIQTEAIFETYKLIFNTASESTKDYMEKILDGAGAEPDSYHTPRIAGMITNSADKPVLFIGMKGFNQPAKAALVQPKPGTMIGISTYKGSLEAPEGRDPAAKLPEIQVKSVGPDEIAKYLFDISEVSYKGNDIRVCAVAGVRKEQTWNISIINVHKS